MNTSGLVSLLKKYDYSFFATSAAIFLIGVINLHSATHASASERMANLYLNQMGWYLLSLVVGVVISFINPKNFQRYAIPVYVFNVFLLVLVLLMGHKGMGAQRWIVIGPVRLQPSELMKISVILTLASWFAKVSPEKSLNFKRLIIPFIIAAVPALLIIVEPDLGTGLLIFLIFAVIAFYRKLEWKTMAILGVLGVVSSIFMYNFGLKEYQKKRVKTFLDPSADARGSGYNAIQSKIAIGSGKFLGKGFKKSSQASLNYLPENHTDFVFSIFNEEHGLLGSAFLIALYLILFFRFLWLANNVTKLFDAIVAIGLLGIFFWHTFINMSMVMGLMPIVGLPLPLMSYGGSSLLTFGICCGLATSISNSRNLF